MSLSDCELALLSYLQQVTGDSMADHVRQAVMAYAAAHSSFNRAGFRRFAEEKIEPGLVKEA